MFTCPKGHQSQASDYCDECGALIGATSGLTATAPSPIPATETVPSALPVAGEPCPDCATPRDGRFCEVCGHDFLLAGYATPAAEATIPAGATNGAATHEDPAPAAKWRLVATADPAYHQRMQAQADPGAEPIALPAFVPERRFELDRPRILIGRRSRSRGIEPEIDLSGPPTDPAVSHAHVLLVQDAGGDWSAVDLDSSNGTYLNGATDSLAPNVATPIADGDVIYLGAWTALTLGSA